MIRLLSLALLLGACAADPSPKAIGSTGHVCKADGLDDLIGKPGSSGLAAEALKRSGAATLRWIQPGMAVTMDFRQDRLDIHLDDKNVVTRITCG
jgi:hypothetical protein